MDLRPDLLLRADLVTSEDLETAIETQRTSGGRILDILVEMGRLTRRQALEALSHQLGIPFLEIAPEHVSPEVLRLIPPRRCKELRVLPLQFKDEGTLWVALDDPTDLARIDDVRFITGLRVAPVLADGDALDQALREVYPELADIQQRIEEIETLDLDQSGPEEAPGVSALDISEIEPHEAPPVISLLNLILKQAILSRTSDIHLEPKERQTRVRFRIDGVLCEKDPIHFRYRNAITARVKVLAHLDITERRVPQDGAFTVIVEGRKVDFRVSTFPSVWGEKTVMRILDKSSLRMSLDDLGFPGKVREGIDAFMHMHDGVFLVTGPTGSGKSTTLYTILGALDSPERNIVTLEDPVEYQIPTITQGQANPRQGFTFASGLRSILRQDPDVILVGEIRDLETARIAVQSSLTGHLVLSTLHTNSAPEAIVRLQDMGLEPFLVAAALRGALAQRLARRLCPGCREPYEPTAEVLEANGIPPEPGLVLYRPVGCRHCGGNGYRGRMGLYELFRMSESIQRLVARGADAKEIRHAAEAEGYRTLREDGYSKVREGRTSLEEVLRVT